MLLEQRIQCHFTAQSFQGNRASCECGHRDCSQVGGTGEFWKKGLSCQKCLPKSTLFIVVTNEARCQLMGVYAGCFTDYRNSSQQLNINAIILLIMNIKHCSKTRLTSKQEGYISAHTMLSVNTTASINRLSMDSSTLMRIWRLQFTHPLPLCGTKSSSKSRIVWISLKIDHLDKLWWNGLLLGIVTWIFVLFYQINLTLRNAPQQLQVANVKTAILYVAMDDLLLHRNSFNQLFILP